MEPEAQPDPYNLQVEILHNAEDPPSVERPLLKVVLTRCSLEKRRLADQQGGPSEVFEIIVEGGSGKTWLFVRKIKDAIYGEVWDAKEVEIVDDLYAVQYDENGRTRKFAVKRMPEEKIEFLRHQCAEDPLKEIATLAIASKPGHQHVLRREAALYDGSTVYLVTPFIDGGEVFDWISSEGGAYDKAKMETVRRLFRQLVEGMEYNHSKGICHADMSLENALVDKERENVFIIDYGMSLLMPVVFIDGRYRRLKSVPDKRKAKTSYCSPEVFKNKAYDGVKVDVFAAGSMLFMMLTGATPFYTATRNDRRFKQLVWKGDVEGLIRKNRPMSQLVGDQAEDLAQAADLLKGLMAYEPEQRLLPETVLQHPWFTPRV